MNLVGEYIKGGVTSLGSSIYKDVVTSTAEDRISLFVQTFIGTTTLLRSMNTIADPSFLNGRIKTILEGACALFIYRNSLSLLSLVQLELIMYFKNESRERVVTNLSSGFYSLLSGNIPVDIVRNACTAAIAILIAFTVFKKMEDRHIPIKFYFLTTSMCAYLLGLKALIEIGEQINSPNP